MHDHMDHCNLFHDITFVFGKVHWGSELVPRQLPCCGHFYNLFSWLLAMLVAYELHENISHKNTYSLSPSSRTDKGTMGEISSVLRITLMFRSQIYIPLWP